MKTYIARCHDCRALCVRSMAGSLAEALASVEGCRSRLPDDWNGRCSYLELGPGEFEAYGADRATIAEPMPDVDDSDAGTNGIEEDNGHPVGGDL